jgi:predicted ATP-grasp superfamily ATP-dependent carboligase
MTMKNKLGELHLLFSRKYLSVLSRQRKFRILFSKKDDWEPFIREDFRYTRHKLTFDSFSPENIKKHDLIIPLVIDDILYLNEVRTLIDDNPIPIPTAESVRLCNDKYLFNKTLIENEFEKFIPRMGKDLKYPYILKKRVDCFGVNSHIIMDKEHEDKFKNEKNSQEYFCQELIYGEKEYATHMIFSKGIAIHSINIEYKYDTDIYIKGKNKSLYNKIVDSQYIYLFCSILELIGFEGLCCINYKVSNNLPLLLEINPRFGGSLSNRFYSFMKHIA